MTILTKNTDKLREEVAAIADTFRALCAELTAWAEKTSAHYFQPPDVLLRARAAPGEADEPVMPEGKKPTRDELWELWLRLNNELPDRPAAVAEFWEHAQINARARASLADEPAAPAPPADGEVAELVSAVHAAYAAYGWVEEKQFIRFFDEVSRLASVIEEGCDCSVDGPINWQDEIELMCQRLKPVPVSERPWEREGWCDVEGRFWAEHISRSGVASWRCAAASDLGGWAVRCLPAHALPLPEVGS